MPWWLAGVCSTIVGRPLRMLCHRKLRVCHFNNWYFLVKPQEILLLPQYVASSNAWHSRFQKPFVCFLNFWFLLVKIEESHKLNLYFHFFIFSRSFHRGRNRWFGSQIHCTNCEGKFSFILFFMMRILKYYLEFSYLRLYCVFMSYLRKFHTLESDIFPPHFYVISDLGDHSSRHRISIWCHQSKF